jgi:ligand-binding SRPBCC domain-containing protein
VPVFDYAFTVRAPLQAVADFHRDTATLKRLTPPPIFVQLHRVEPLAEGSVSEFTLWFGPLPVHWTAVHSNVNALRGFTDTQRGGLLQAWQHSHTFTPEGPGATRVSEHVEYAHRPGGRGLLSRILFAPPALRFLFWYRSFVTRRALERE